MIANKLTRQQQRGQLVPWEKVINKMQIEVVQKLNSRMLHVLDVTKKIMWLVSAWRKPKMNLQG